MNYLDLSHNFITEEILLDIEEMVNSGLGVKIINLQGCGVLPVTSKNVNFLKKVEELGVKLII